MTRCCMSVCSADEAVVRLRGQQLTLPYLAQHGWERPILLDSVEGLGMQLPPADSFTVYHIENYVGMWLPSGGQVCR